MTNAGGNKKGRSHYDRVGDKAGNMEIHWCPDTHVKTYKLQFVISCEEMTVSLRWCAPSKVHLKILGARLMCG